MFKQKIKHLLFEHKTAIDQLRTENTVALKVAAEHHRVANLELRRDKASLKEQIHREQLEHEELVKTLKKVCMYGTVRDSMKSVVLRLGLG